MGLVHTPRVVAAVARGYWRHRILKQQQQSLGQATASPIMGLGPTDPHIYLARANIFDVDYLGHMNNAAYLAHAELARWEWIASNGMLMTMLRHNVAFFVAGCTIRYRREIRPLYRKFEIQSYLAGFDERNLWIYQTFRYPEKGNNRIRAQYLSQAVVIQGKQVLSPRDYYVNLVGLDAALVDEFAMTTAPSMDEMMSRYEKLDQAMRVAASEDDERTTGE